MQAMEVDPPLSSHTPFAASESAAANQEVGVGIVFQPLDDGTLYVKRLKEGEPAARSGLIKVVSPPSSTMLFQPASAF
jgi:hypothetical protein